MSIVKLSNRKDVEFKKAYPFIVWAYRWGSKEYHSYPVGIYKDLAAAKHNAGKEFHQRGGKYSTVIYATRSNTLFEIYEYESPYRHHFLNDQKRRAERVE